jgi:transcriptional regulator
MYIPDVFAVTDRQRLHDFIEQHSFGLLVSQEDDCPFASHLPFLLDRASGPNGTLIGHMARANPQWEQAREQTVLTIFAGPHAYISPTWYEADRVVPTWNYTAVHAYGRFEVIEEKETLLDIVRETVRFYEQAMPTPWTLTGPETFLDRMLSQIVGFRIPLARIEGKWKLNQNHPAERRRKVVQALQEQGNENAQAVAALMQERLLAEE